VPLSEVEEWFPHAKNSASFLTKEEIITTTEEHSTFLTLTERGIHAAEQGLIEERLWKQLPTKISDISAELQPAIRILLREKTAIKENDTLVSNVFSYTKQRFLNNCLDSKFTKEFVERGLVKTRRVTRTYYSAGVRLPLFSVQKVGLEIEPSFSFLYQHGEDNRVRLYDIVDEEL
jgi:hypothetical protein